MKNSFDIKNYLAANRVFVPNNGLFGVKCVLSMKNWLITQKMDPSEIYFLGMATKEDVDSQLEYLNYMDDYIMVPSGSADLNFNNVDLLLDLAVDYNVTAVWPGWGYTSENPRLPANLNHVNKITFIGPSSVSMSLLGNKVNIYILAQTLGIPVIDWNGAAVRINLDSPESMLKQIEGINLTESFEAFCRENKQILIKDPNGGGGRGIISGSGVFNRSFTSFMAMKKLSNVRHVEIQVVCDMYKNVFIIGSRDCSIQRRYQKLIEFAPAIDIKESTYTKMQNDTARICLTSGYNSVGTAEFLVSSNGEEYFLLEFNPRLQVEHPVTELAFADFELNLPALQFLVANGIDLVEYLFGELKIDTPNAVMLDDGHKYYSFMEAKKNLPRYCVGVRIVSENPSDNFKPSLGKINCLKYPSLPNVLSYFNVASTNVQLNCSSVHMFMDSQIGHVFSVANDFKTCVVQLLQFFTFTSINGQIVTNFHFIQQMLIHFLYSPVFCFSSLTTDYINKFDGSNSPLLSSQLSSTLVSASVDEAASKKRFISTDSIVFVDGADTLNEYYTLINRFSYSNRVSLGAIGCSIFLARFYFKICSVQFRSAVERGLPIKYETLTNSVNVKFSCDKLCFFLCVFQTGPKQYSIKNNLFVGNDQDSSKSVVVVDLVENKALATDEDLTFSLVFESGSVNFNSQWKGPLTVEEFVSSRDYSRNYIQVENYTFTIEIADDLKKNYTLLRSPSAGRLLNRLVKENELVYSFTNYAVIEVMKMELTLDCGDLNCIYSDSKFAQKDPSARIHWRKQTGAFVIEGEILAELLPFGKKFAEEALSSESEDGYEIADRVFVGSATKKSNKLQKNSYKGNFLKELQKLYSCKVNTSKGASPVEKDDNAFYKTFISLRNTLSNYMKGFVTEQSIMDSNVKRFFSMLSKNDLIVSMIKFVIFCIRNNLKITLPVVLNVAGGKMLERSTSSSSLGTVMANEPLNATLENFYVGVENLLFSFVQNINSVFNRFPYAQLEKLTNNLIYVVSSTFPPTFSVNSSNIANKLQPLIELMQNLSNGQLRYRQQQAIFIMNQFLECEKHFNNDDRLINMISSNQMSAPSSSRSNLTTTLSISNLNNTSAGSSTEMAHYEGLCRAHAALNYRSKIVSICVDYLQKSIFHNISDIRANNSEILSVYQELASLQSSLGTSISNSSREFVDLCVRCRKLLIYSTRPSFQIRCNQMELMLMKTFENLDDFKFHQYVENGLIYTADAIFDVLPHFYYHKNEYLRMASLEVYVRRCYSSYNDLCNFKHFKIKIASDNICNCLTFHYDLAGASSLSSSKYSTKFDNKACKAVLVLSFEKGIAAIQEFFANFHRFSKFFPYKPISQLFVISGDTANVCDKLSSVYSLDELESKNKSKSKSKSENSVSQSFIFNVLSEIVQKEKAQFSWFVNSLTFSVYFSTYPGMNNFSENIYYMYTFDSSRDFEENVLFRNIDPPSAYQLELDRLDNFNIKLIETENPLLHIYLGVCKSDPTDVRYFIRTFLRKVENDHVDNYQKQRLDSVNMNSDDLQYLLVVSQIRMLEAMAQMEALSNDNRTDCNHFFFNVLPVIRTSPEKLIYGIKSVVIKNGARLWNNRVMFAELKIKLKTNELEDEAYKNVRMIVANQTGCSMVVSLYEELEDGMSKLVMTSDENVQDFVNEPNDEETRRLWPAYIKTHYHIPIKTLEQKMRKTAIYDLNTYYAYDIPHYFNYALRSEWKRHLNMCRLFNTFSGKFLSKYDDDKTESLCEFSQIPLSDKYNGNDDDGNDEGKIRPGAGRIGIVAWDAVLYTPDYPKEVGGRRVVVVSNDITISRGAFGVSECNLFVKAAEHALKHKLPFIFLPNTAGAKISINEKLKSNFIASKTFDSLYVPRPCLEKDPALKDLFLFDETDDESTDVVIKSILSDNECNINSIHSCAQLMQVMNTCYENIFTLSVISLYSVGVGAYLVRLGRRAIQNIQSHVILTGATTLNRLLGQTVYKNNVQLGGPQISSKNGTTQIVTADDFTSMNEVLRWLSYVPRKKCMKDIYENYARIFGIFEMRNIMAEKIQVRFANCMNECNVKKWLCGVVNIEYAMKGFLDDGSFCEYGSDWSKTVIAGRGRLGGVPVAVLIANVGVVEYSEPLDPADSKTAPKKTLRPSQVIHPETAFKISQMISDFNGECLPLFLFPNYRGFSGGMTDMFHEMLKFGSSIVTELTKYKWPITMCLLPNTELRGGAWAVFDSNLNRNMIEMYCCTGCKANILEPDATAEIKFRHHDYINLHRRMTASEERRSLEEQKSVYSGKRNKVDLKTLKKKYYPLARLFCSLHDSADCIKLTGVIDGILEEENLRSYFYYRMRVKLSLKRIGGDEADLRQLEKVLLERYKQEGGEPFDETGFCQWLDGQ